MIFDCHNSSSTPFFFLTSTRTSVPAYLLPPPPLFKSYFSPVQLDGGSLILYHLSLIQQGISPKVGTVIIPALKIVLQKLNCHFDCNNVFI